MSKQSSEPSSLLAIPLLTKPRLHVMWLTARQLSKARSSTVCRDVDGSRSGRTSSCAYDSKISCFLYAAVIGPWAWVSSTCTRPVKWPPIRSTAWPALCTNVSTLVSKCGENQSRRYTTRRPDFGPGGACRPFWLKAAAPPWLEADASPELGPGGAEPWLEAGGPGAAGPPAGGPLERSKIQEMYVKTSGNR